MNSEKRVLRILSNNMGEYVSGESIAESLNVSRNAVWKTINSIKSGGIEVLASKKLGYMLPKGTDIIFEEDIRSHLVGELKGVPIHYYDTIDSTNDYAKELAKQGTPDYTLVVADTQTHGKGRMGRSFSSPSGTGVYMSIVLYPNTSMETSQLITSCVAVAVSKAIDTLCGSSSKIKWVNDIFLNGRKVSGTLTEGSLDFETNTFNYAVVGIGINVRSVKGVFDSELSSIATSIEDETGVLVTRSELIAEVFNNVYLQLQRIEDKSFLEEYVERSLIIGEDVIVSENGVDTNAKAIGIDSTAGLVVRFEDGTTKVLNSGEARIRKNP
jgi:BirA family biotin operon repressor/biotin-[acetyl-CoA-carboxylase] ligase